MSLYITMKMFLNHAKMARDWSWNDLICSQHLSPVTICPLGSLMSLCCTKSTRTRPAVPSTYDVQHYRQMVLQQIDLPLPCTSYRCNQSFFLLFLAQFFIFYLQCQFLVFYCCSLHQKVAQNAAVIYVIIFCLLVSPSTRLWIDIKLSIWFDHLLGRSLLALKNDAWRTVKWNKSVSLLSCWTRLTPCDSATSGYTLPSSSFLMAANMFLACLLSNMNFNGTTYFIWLCILLFLCNFF